MYVLTPECEVEGVRPTSETLKRNWAAGWPREVILRLRTMYYERSGWMRVLSSVSVSRLVARSHRLKFFNPHIHELYFVTKRYLSISQQWSPFSERVPEFWSRFPYRPPRHRRRPLFLFTFTAVQNGARQREEAERAAQARSKTFDALKVCQFIIGVSLSLCASLCLSVSLSFSLPGVLCVAARVQAFFVESTTYQIQRRVSCVQ